MKLFHSKTPSRNLRHLKALAECTGIPSEFVEVMNSSSLDTMMKDLASSPEAGAVLDLASLRHVLDPAQLRGLATSLSDVPVKLLLLVTEMDGVTNGILNVLTQGVVHSVEPAGKPEKVTFPEASRAWNCELAGHSYVREPIAALSLAIDRKSDTNVIVELDNSASFASLRLGKAEFFVWSTFEVMDTFRPLSAESEFEKSTDQYIPATIFLRSAFGDRCWRNPYVGAAIVIDDPLLKRNYGFINFPDLLDSARKHGYRVTLAFIPWNSWRSHVGQVRIFREHQDCFSLCAHGCDHTNNEYGSVDYDSLLGKNIVAAERMERHRQRTGIPCEAVMVCPQEKYSLQAMQAFSDSSQFLALVNTSCLPRNLTTPQVCAADLLLPAQDSFYGFPVFKRHYWKDMSAFAMDRFFGKPAILVEHHDFFRYGCAGAEGFASQLSQLSPTIEWTPVSEIVTKTHSQRRLTRTEWAVRFFSRRFQLTHIGEAATYHLSKRIPGSTIIKQVLLNGVSTPFSRKADMVEFDFHAQAPQTMHVEIEPSVVKPAKAYSFRLKYQANVALRRALSEFRDNVVSKNRFALRVGKSLMRAMKATDNLQSTGDPK